jgi:ADP-ribose pyrophosphatase
MGDDNKANIPDKELFQARIFTVVERMQIGRSGALLRRQVVKHPGAVGIVPILPDGRVLLIKQYRIALEKEIFEIPAGTREPGESPLTTAKRELIEETGYRSDAFTQLSTIYTSPGILQEELTLYLATDLEPGESAPEDGERIALTPLEWSEIDDMIRVGEISDGKTLAGLFLALRQLGKS